jgi:hypothetical protein
VGTGLLHGSGKPVQVAGNVIGHGCIHGITCANGRVKWGKGFEKSACDIAGRSLNKLIPRHLFPAMTTQQKGYYPARRTIKEPMKSLRQFVFFFLLSCTGLLWAAFLLFNSSWFLPGIAMIGLIPATNVIVLILWLRS